MLTLSGSNTYAGTTTVNAGTLCITSPLPAGGLMSVPAGTLEIAPTATVARDVTVSGGNLSLGGTLSLGRLTLTGGTITTGVGARAASVDLSQPGSGVANATNPLAITTQLKVPAGVIANYTPGGSATAFTASGSNLADNSVARTLALSGGTLAMIPPPAGRILPIGGSPLAWFSFVDPANLGKDITGNGYNATPAGSPAAAAAKFGGDSFNGGQTLTVGNY